MKKQLQINSHRRYNILTGEWVLVSPHRNRRPWQGKEDKVAIRQRESYDAECYLCPGNIRSTGAANPLYKDTYVFINDFSALKTNEPQFKINDGLLKAESESGICKVICFSPDHSKSLSEMPVADIEKVVSVWQQEYLDLSKLENINHVQIFENKGSIMGCSNPHPHGQIWAQSTVPNEILKKDAKQKQYFTNKNSSLLEDYIKQESELNERIIFENQEFVVLVPFWAVWPFETMILPRKSEAHIGMMTTSRKSDFASAIKKLTAAYDKLFNCSFPYSSGIHQAPANNENHQHWHWHMSFYPPLLRSSTVKKFMVGYEMFAMPQRDITPEFAAKQLRNII